MKIGLVVEGRSEFDALPSLAVTLEAATGNQILRPLLAEVTPLAPIGVIARAVAHLVERLEAEDVETVIILMDREQRPECPGVLADRLGDALNRRRIWRCTIQVVIKDRTFENWLIADPAALAAQPGRYHPGRVAERRVAPNRADAVDAMGLLRAAVVGDRFDKRRDSVRILERADPVTMAANSRSFRRFLRCIGHPNYRDQSRAPHTRRR